MVSRADMNAKIIQNKVNEFLAKKEREGMGREIAFTN